MISPAYIKRVLYAIPVFLMMCGMLTTSSAQKFKAEAYTDTNKILIGDQVTLTLILNNQFGKEVLWPEIGDTITSAVEVIDRTDSDTLRRHDDGTLEIARVYKITSFDSGFFVIPSFRFIEADDSSSMAETEAILIEVHTLEVDTAEAFKDIKTPYGVPYTWDEFIPEAIVTVGILAFLFLVYLLLRYLKNRPKKEIVEEVIVGDPYEIAIESLQRLDEKKLWQQDKIKEYYTELTDIIRTYIENRYDIIAREMTTDEIMESLIYVQVTPDDREKLGQLLLMADMVKFAKSRPIANEHEMGMARAYNFVRDTRQTQDSLTPELHTEIKSELS